jgi:hypothetical protein
MMSRRGYRSNLPWWLLLGSGLEVAEVVEVAVDGLVVAAAAAVASADSVEEVLEVVVLEATGKIFQVSSFVFRVSSFKIPQTFKL